MKDLYGRLRLRGPETQPDRIRSVLAHGAVSAADRRDAEFVLLDSRRRRVYDQTWKTLTLLGQLRANLGLTHGENWSEHEFNAAPTRASELALLGAHSTAKTDTEYRQHESTGIGKYAVFAILLVILLFALSAPDNSPQQLDSSRAASRQVSPAFDEPAQALPSTGVYQAYRSNRIAPFRIVTRGDGNFFIRMVDVGSGNIALELFVRGGEVTETRMPLGSFELRYASGDTWYGPTHLFGPSTSYNKADSVFQFQQTGREISGYTVELYQQRDGNLHTRSIDAAQF